METRVAVMSIIVEDTGSVEPINNLLHEYGAFIIGRMGIPCPPGSPAHRISQAKILEWVAVSFSRGSSRHRD